MFFGVLKTRKKLKPEELEKENEDVATPPPNPVTGAPVTAFLHFAQSNTLHKLIRMLDLKNLRQTLKTTAPEQLLKWFYEYDDMNQTPLVAAIASKNVEVKSQQKKKK